jgi:hypothetical protein
MNFFACCFGPQVLEEGILDLFSVVCDGFFGDRVHYTIAIFFDFNHGACIVVAGKGSENRDGRGIPESQVNDMIQCLAQHFAGGTVADEFGGVSWQGGWPGWWCCNVFVIRFNNRK